VENVSPNDARATRKRARRRPVPRAPRRVSRHRKRARVSRIRRAKATSPPAPPGPLTRATDALWQAECHLSTRRHFLPWAVCLPWHACCVHVRRIRRIATTDPGRDDPDTRALAIACARVARLAAAEVTQAESVPWLESLTRALHDVGRLTRAIRAARRAPSAPASCWVVAYDNGSRELGVCPHAQGIVVGIVARDAAERFLYVLLDKSEARRLRDAMRQPETSRAVEVRDDRGSALRVEGASLTIEQATSESASFWLDDETAREMAEALDAHARRTRALAKILRGEQQDRCACGARATVLVEHETHVELACGRCAAERHAGRAAAR
jgi:hypothetical protein